MEILTLSLLVGSGMYLNSKEAKQQQVSKQTLRTQQLERRNLDGLMMAKGQELDQSKEKADGAFRVQFFKKKEINNPNFNQSSLWQDADPNLMDKVKARVDLNKPRNLEQEQLNDVGFKSANQETFESYGNQETIPSMDDKDRDIQLIHNNMVPFFGSTVKQNVNDTAMTQHVLEAYTGNFRHTRRDNKTEVEYLFDPTPNNQLPYGSSVDMVTNRDQTRFFPSATGKKHNDLPFEQIQVGPGVGDGYTARPSGGFHQDVRILPKTTEELKVNPKITYEGRIKAGKAPTEKGKVVGRQILKKPKAIMYNWNGERNFTGVGVHKKNRQRPDIIFRCTNRDKQHSEYRGNAGPTRDSQSTPESLRGKKRLASKRNFLNTPHRNLGQVTGKRMNDFSKSGFENRETERSMTGTRTHYTNVTQVGGKRGQQYNFNQNGVRYTRKQDTIANRPGSAGTCKVEVSGKSGPVNYSQGGPVYDPNQTAKVTVKQTTEDNRHRGFVNGGQFRKAGVAYDAQGWAGKTTVKETTEDRNHLGFVGQTTYKGPSYNGDETARVTVKETTEDRNHLGFINGGQTRRAGQAYDVEGWTGKTTVKQTTEDNRHRGFVDGGRKAGQAYDAEGWTGKTTVKETTEDNRHRGFVGRTAFKGKAYDQNDTAKVTVKETTEDNRYIQGANRGALQNGGGYKTTNVEAPLPQKAYLCNHEYVGSGEATTNKKPRSYSGEYNVNTNKEQIAVGRAPNEVKNSINIGKEGYNICINKLEIDREVPHVIGKGTSIGNIYNPDHISRCNLTSRKNVTPTQIDRLQIDTLDHVKNNPLQINQNLN